MSNIGSITSTPVTTIVPGGHSQEGSKPAANTKAAAPQQPTPAQTKSVPATAEKARYEAVKRASESYVSNYYAVSDVSFTIFKDSTGDYVTRFRSLKDGSVKYSQQQDLFEFVQVQSGEATILSTEA